MYLLDHGFKKLTFRSFLLVLNQMRIKVACKEAKSFLILFLVTLDKDEVQESNLHQMSHKKVYFLTCFMQNVQKLKMAGCRALNERANHYGPPCTASFWPIYPTNFRFYKYVKWISTKPLVYLLHFLAKSWILYIFPGDYIPYLGL